MSVPGVTERRNTEGMKKRNKWGRGERLTVPDKWKRSKKGGLPGRGGGLWYQHAGEKVGCWSGGVEMSRWKVKNVVCLYLVFRLSLLIPFSELQIYSQFSTEASNFRLSTNYSAQMRQRHLHKMENQLNRIALTNLFFYRRVVIFAPAFAIERWPFEMS